MIVRRASEPARLLVLDKPEGPTSFDVVRLARKVTGCRRVGHGGTLDPFASGVLVVGVGAATRLLGYAAAGAKRYRATFRFGQGTDSHDRTGRPTSSRPLRFDPMELRDVLDRFVGEIHQRPPRVSAIKVAGERSYRLHREGRGHELASRSVRIHAIEIERLQLPEIQLSIECGGGTYVRALARDVGEALDCPAHVTALRREAVGPFSLEDTVDLEGLEREWPDGRRILTPVAIARNWPRLRLPPPDVRRVRHGGQPLAAWAEEAGWSTLPERVALLDEDDRLVAVASPRSGELRLDVVMPESADAHGDH